MSVTRYLDPNDPRNQNKVAGFMTPSSQIVEDSTGRNDTGQKSTTFMQNGVIPAATMNGSVPMMDTASTATNTSTSTPITTSNSTSSPSTTYNWSNLLSGNSANNIYNGLGFDLSNLPYLAALFSLLSSGGGMGGGGDAKNEKYGKGGGFDLDSALAEAKKYGDELRVEAQGDYDFIIKWLKKQHETALGTDDTERAKFFELVANQFEEKVGRIPFDYYRRTEREKQDINLYLQEADKKAQDIATREQQFGKQQAYEVGQENTQRGQTFNARGLSGSGLEQKKAGEQATYRDLFVTQPAQRAFGMEKTNLLADTVRQGLTSQRNLEDIATTGRRGGQDAENTYQEGSESAQRKLDKALAEIRRNQAGEEINLKNLFNLYSLAKIRRNQAGEENDLKDLSNQYSLFGLS